MTIKPRLSSVFVPPDGPDDADIYGVGEAPGKEEETHRVLGRLQPTPFVGKSGSVMRSYFHDRLSVPPTRLRFNNLCPFRPEKNKFEYCLDTSQLADGLKALREDIERVNPKVIVAFGAWPAFFLAGKTNDRGEPGTGILNWRGSIVPSKPEFGSRKVVCSMHPAFLIRSWAWHPIFQHDLARVKEQADFPEIRAPLYEVFIDPPEPDLGILVEEMSQAEWLTIDIENFTDQTISCVGFSDRPGRALVITYRLDIWRQVVAELCTSPAKKNFQYGTYDINFLSRFYKIPVRNYAFDTYIAAASLMPAFPRGLDFLTSIYTEMPYYKEDRKTWKKSGDLDILWQYNAKDDVSQTMVAQGQMKELEELFGVPVRKEGIFG